MFDLTFDVCIYILDTVDWTLGQLKQINLLTGSVANLTPKYTLNKTIGLIFSADWSVAYVSKDTGGFYTLNVNTGLVNILPVSSGITNSAYLTWESVDQAFYVTSMNRSLVYRVNILTTPATYDIIADINSGPCSVVRGFGANLYVITPSTLFRISWTQLFSLNSIQPTILRLGDIPSSSISGGLATTVNTTVFTGVSNAPFGGTIEIGLNFAKMRLLKAKYYKIYMDQNETPEYASWTNSELVGTTLQLMSITPDSLGRYLVPSSTNVRAIPDLGFSLDTGQLQTSTTHTLRVVLYNSKGLQINIPVIEQDFETISFFVDNTPPQVQINGILQFGSPISLCGVVHSDPLIHINITVYDPAGSLLSYSLDDDYYGGLSSAPITSDSYSRHLPSTSWVGIHSRIFEWNLCDTSAKCSHNFQLSAMGRTIVSLFFLMKRAKRVL